MALSNRDRVGRAFEALATGLRPYVDRRMRMVLKTDTWANDYAKRSTPPLSEFSLDDPSFLLRVMADTWDGAFRSELGRTERNLVFELRDVRNGWAHNKTFSVDDAYRALDSIERVLVAVDAREATEVGRSKDDLMRLRYEDQTRRAMARGADAGVASTAVAGLTPWRDVVVPHDDVTQFRRLSMAEFAADLYQVRAGEGRAEYSDPVEFFRRTFVTEGLRQLLAQAATRVSSTTEAIGAPVIDLQTTFGGGKTHSMIALYHLLSGAAVTAFPQDVQDLLGGVGIAELPQVRRVVIVGNQLSPGQANEKADGTVVRTMWGELAWQLGGAEGFRFVAEADRTSTNPGDNLRALLREYSPCLILIDEWVAYARDLLGKDDATEANHFGVRRCAGSSR